jgi:hypothetical protein
MEEKIMLQKLSNGFLIDAYLKANSLNLDHYFIFLIEKELSNRGLSCIRSQYSYLTTKAVKVNSEC